MISSALPKYRQPSARENGRQKPRSAFQGESKVIIIISKPNFSRLGVLNHRWRRCLKVLSLQNRRILRI